MGTFHSISGRELFVETMFLLWLLSLSAVSGNVFNETQLLERIERLEEREEEIKMELREEMDMLKSELSKKENEVGLYVRDNVRAALAEVPYLAVCAYKQVWEPEILETAITFDKFLANFNNADQPGGGDGQLDLNTGVFTCLTPGHYTISYTASAGNWGDGLVRVHQIYLYLNGEQVPESYWRQELGEGGSDSESNGLKWSFASRTLILHMEQGDTLDLRMVEGRAVYLLSFTINLTAPDF